MDNRRQNRRQQRSRIMLIIAAVIIVLAAVILCIALGVFDRTGLFRSDETAAESGTE